MTRKYRRHGRLGEVWTKTGQSRPMPNPWGTGFTSQFLMQNQYGKLCWVWPWHIFPHVKTIKPKEKYL